ncbi:MAG: hypothetical protein COB66_04960 [Coxiella sp. (in: Bacteria)]|nr:MAG: hypothetical protein COB66_04960 [Coxiella sp. (in: g-proteobacteria)]
MLQKFGEHIRGWFAGIVIGVIAVAFVAWGLEYYIDRDAGSTAAVAVVNGGKITQQSFSNKVLMDQRRQEKVLGRALSEQELVMLKKMALNQMIAQLILTQAAKKEGFNVSLGAIEGSLESTPGFNMQSALQNTGLSTPAAFFDYVRNTVLVQQMVTGLRSSAFVIPDELKNAFSVSQQKRDFSFTMLPIAKLEQKITVTDKEIAQYYKANATQFTIPEKVQLQYLLLSRATLNAQIKVTDAEVKSYYESNKANFRVPASWKIARITTKTQKEMDALQAALKSGKTFAAAVKEKHKDWQQVTQTVSAVDASASLATLLNQLKVNQVSEPMSTPGGVTIVQLLGRTPQHARAFDSVKTQVKTMLVGQQLEKIVSKKSEQLSNLTYTNPTSLEPAANAIGIAVKTSPLLAQAGAKTGLFAQKPVLDAAFSQDVLKGGNNSNPVSLKNGGIIVLRVAKHVPSSVQPLATVKADIVTALKKQLALRQIGARAYAVQSQLNKGKSEPSLHWQKRVNATRLDPATNKAILETAFSTPLNQVKTAELDAGYALVKVTAIHPGNWAKATAAEKKGLGANLAALHGQNEFQIYLQGLNKQAKVDIKDKKLSSSWSV